MDATPRVWNIPDIAAENCVVLIYVNINEPRHHMMRTSCALVGVDPVGLRAANSRDRYHHLAAANLPSHRKIYFLLPLKYNIE